MVIIAGFPGVGKSYFHKNVKKFKSADSDSSQFSWIESPTGDKIRNPNFINDYMNHINGLVHKDIDFILTSTHEDVISALIDSGYRITIVAPKVELKELYLKKYKERGSPDSFIELMDKNWESFLNDIKLATKRYGVELIELEANQTLTDVYMEII